MLQPVVIRVIPCIRYIEGVASHEDLLLRDEEAELNSIFSAHLIEPITRHIRSRLEVSSAVHRAPEAFRWDGDQADVIGKDGFGVFAHVIEVELQATVDWDVAGASEAPVRVSAFLDALLNIHSRLDSDAMRHFDGVEASIVDEPVWDHWGAGELPLELGIVLDGFLSL